MDGGLVQIIVAAITVCVPALVTILTTKSVKPKITKQLLTNTMNTIIAMATIILMKKYLSTKFGIKK